MALERKSLLINYNSSSDMQIYPHLNSINFTHDIERIERQYLKGRAYSPKDLLKFKHQDSISISFDGDMFYPEIATKDNYGKLFTFNGQGKRITPFLFTWQENSLHSAVSGLYPILPVDSNGNRVYYITQEVDNRISRMIDNYLVLVTPNQAMQIDDIIIENQTFTIDAESMVLNESYDMRGTGTDWVGNKVDAPDQNNVMMYQDFDNLSSYKLSALKFNTVKQSLNYDGGSWIAPFVDMSLSLDYAIEINDNYINDVEQSKTELNPTQTLNLTLVDDSSQDFNYMMMQKDKDNGLTKLRGAKIEMEVRKDNNSFFGFNPGRISIVMEIGDNSISQIETYSYETLERGYTQDGTPTFTISYSLPSFAISIKEVS